jgi:hypothetical protein
VAQRVVIYFWGRKGNFPTQKLSMAISEKLMVAFSSLPFLFMPLLIIGGIITGWFTPTDASGVAVAYGFLLTFVYRRGKVSFKEVRNVFSRSVLTAVCILSPRPRVRPRRRQEYPGSRPGSLRSRSALATFSFSDAPSSKSRSVFVPPPLFSGRAIWGGVRSGAFFCPVEAEARSGQAKEAAAAKEAEPAGRFRCSPMGGCTGSA